MSRPTNLMALKRRISNLEHDQIRETQRQNLMASVVVGQMLPEGIVKGGSAMAFRYGPGARLTKDLDAARKIQESRFIEELASNLDRGWQGFTGRVKRLEKPKPVGVPGRYVMVPFDIKLQYEGKDWKTVRFELGHNELGAVDSGEYWLSVELVDLFTELGFDAPKPIRVMSVEYQIAQKIHAATSPNSERAHDLIDLQILICSEDIDFSKVRELCESIFNYRQEQDWPSVFAKSNGWVGRYQAAKDEMTIPGVPILELDDAIVWGNELIQKISHS